MWLFVNKLKKNCLTNEKLYFNLSKLTPHKLNQLKSKCTGYIFKMSKKIVRPAQIQKIIWLWIVFFSNKQTNLNEYEKISTLKSFNKARNSSYNSIKNEIILT